MNDNLRLTMENEEQNKVIEELKKENAKLKQAMGQQTLTG